MGTLSRIFGWFLTLLVLLCPKVILSKIHLSLAVHIHCVYTVFMVILLETWSFAKGIRFCYFPSFLATFNNSWQLSVLLAILTAKIQDSSLPPWFCTSKQE